MRVVLDQQAECFFCRWSYKQIYYIPINYNKLKNIHFPVSQRMGHRSGTLDNPTYRKTLCQQVSGTPFMRTKQKTLSYQNGNQKTAMNTVENMNAKKIRWNRSRYSLRDPANKGLWMKSDSPNDADCALFVYCMLVRNTQTLNKRHPDFEKT